MDLEAVLARDLAAQVPARVRPFLARGERAVIVIRGIPGAIVATDRRVIVERTSTPGEPQIYPYNALTGAVGRLGLFGRRSVSLAGPGLETDLNVFEIARSRNATVVAVWRLFRYRRSVDELTALITAMRRPEPRPPRPRIRGAGEKRVSPPRTSRR